MSEILAHIPEILVAAAFVVAIVLFFARYAKASPEEKRKIIAEIIYALAVKAEAVYGSKTGVIKKKQVISWFYEKYPALSYVMTADELSECIDAKALELTKWMRENPEAAANILLPVIVESDEVNEEGKNGD